MTHARRHTILVVDDTPENISVLGELLQPFYSVRVATNGQRALVTAASEPCPDLILLDVMMPEMDGYTVLTKLRENPKTADIPVIFVTALDATDEETKGLELGAADYISKPLRPSVVLARVSVQVELKQARDRLRNQNAWLEAEVARRMAENQQIQDVSIRALANIAETRDNETGCHILRTQGYVNVLCQELAKAEYADELNAASIELITQAAPLHDIGKVGIPDSILLKPGKLTSDEWMVMKTHPQLGAEAIHRAIQDKPNQSVFEFLRVVMSIAHYHHEKWDGSGYPDGLVGAAIPIPARVMALADVFDALINRRCYKEAMSYDETTRIIIEGSGNHFDPNVVNAFIRCKHQFIEIAENFKDVY